MSYKFFESLSGIEVDNTWDMLDHGLVIQF